LDELLVETGEVFHSYFVTKKESKERAIVEVDDWVGRSAAASPRATRQCCNARYQKFRAGTDRVDKEKKKTTRTGTWADSECGLTK
jgi:hypothetical protein